MPNSAVSTTVHSVLVEPRSYQLSVDVEAYIAQFCTHDTLTRLSRVNRSWYQSAEPSLYNQIRTTWDMRPALGSESSLRFLRKLAQNPRRAALVRTLDASRVRHPDYRQPLHCTRCENARPDTCSSTIMPYPTSLLGDLIEPGATGRSSPPDADTRIRAAARSKLTACLSAKKENILVFWSNLYLALKACTNLRAIFLPPGEAVCGLTALFMRLLRDRAGSNFSVLQIPWDMLLPQTGDSWGTPMPTVDLAPVVERLTCTATSSHLQVFVIEDMFANRGVDLSRLNVLSRRAFPSLSTVRRGSILFQRSVTRNLRRRAWKRTFETSVNTLNGGRT